MDVSGFLNLSVFRTIRTADEAWLGEVGPVRLKIKGHSERHERLFEISKNSDSGPLILAEPKWCSTEETKALVFMRRAGDNDTRRRKAWLLMQIM